MDQRNARSDKSVTHLRLPQRKTKPLLNVPYQSPYQKHKDLLRYYKPLKAQQSFSKTEKQILIENHKFIHDEDSQDSWESRLALKYYDKLYKEYCLANFSKYKTKIGLRWRTTEEVIAGKGQFICGNLKCSKTELNSFEVDFGYFEDGIKKNALVKLRVCKKCAKKLHYSSRHQDGSPGPKNVEVVESNHLDQSKDHSETDGSDISEHDAKRIKVEEEEDNEWTKPIELNDQKTIEQEMDDFLNDLFL